MNGQCRFIIIEDSFGDVFRYAPGFWYCRGRVLDPTAPFHAVVPHGEGGWVMVFLGLWRRLRRLAGAVFGKGGGFAKAASSRAGVYFRPCIFVSVFSPVYVLGVLRILLRQRDVTASPERGGFNGLPVIWVH